MKIRKIRFFYQEPLTEDQEKILIVNLQEIRKRALQALDTAVKDMERKAVRMALGSRREIMKVRFETLANIASEKITLNKINEKTYEFQYPEEDVTGMSFEFAGKRITFARLIPEKKLVSFIQKEVAGDMQIDGSTITYEVETEELP
jgi:hypothetical protein